MKPTSNGPLGILMLDTRFPRIKGDIGNAQSFDFPVIFRRMEGIGSADAVTTHPDRPRVLAALEANARALVAEGAVGLSTRGRDTGDAQFFLDLVDNPRFDHEYTVFGQLLNGIEVVDRILEGDVIERVEIMP